MSGQENTHSTIDFDSLYSTPNYLVSIQQFLDEADHLKALTYWVKEFTNTRILLTTEDLVLAVQRAISDIDHLINEQLNCIIHDKKFKALEASWRGLWYLVEQTRSSKNIKIKALNIKWDEISRDISKALEFDQSQIFRKIYSEEYDTPGGEPYGIIIGDYEISHKTSDKEKQDDIATLRGLSQVSAAAFSPFIASASPKLFGLDSFAQLAQPLDLQNIFSQSEYIKWQTFRESADSQFVGLVLPHILMRKPYRKKPGTYKGMFFHEQEVDKNGSTCCWGNAAYAFGAILIREFASVGWFGHIRGTLRNQLDGGLITNLVCDSFETDAAEIANKPVTDVIVTDVKERELNDLGLIPLCQCYDTTYAAFYGNQSTHKVIKTANNFKNVNAQLAVMLQHVLCGSRIAHYIKVMIRDKIGSFMSAEDCENFLRDWLFKYTTGREDLEWGEQARYPLRESLIKVSNHPEKPGNYICVIQLRPHYQLDHMVSELELITELAQSA